MTSVTSRVLEYDAVRRRLWILGQRCHHGATGALLTSGILVARAAGARSRRATAIAGAGTLLMVHDWHDRSLWFRPGHGSQP